MADPICVSIAYDVKEKDVFDKKLFNKNPKPALLEKMKKTIPPLLTKKGFVVKDDCKEGFFMEATLLSLKADDASKPTSLDTKVSIKVTALGGTAQVFTASGNSKSSGINPKKMEEEAKLVVGDALEDTLTKRAIPQMLKTAP